MNTRNLLSTLLFYAISAVNSREYNAKAWNDASIYLREAMTNAKPCESFYEHVCGNYRNNSVSSYDEVTTAILTKAIKKINLRNPDITEYERAVKVFYNRCTSSGLDRNWHKRLFTAITKRIGEFPLITRLKIATNATAQHVKTSFNPWQFIGLVQRQLGQTLAVKASVSYVEEDCQTKARLALETESPEDDDDDSFTAEAIREQILWTTESFDLDEDALEAVIEPWLNEVTTLYNAWKNLTIEGDGDWITLGNMSRKIPNFDWRAYLRGLLPDNVTRSLESDLNNWVHVSDLQLMDGIGELFKNHSEDAIKSLAFLKVYYESAASYGEAKEWCLDYAKRHFAPAVARVYFDAIGVPPLKWRYEIQALGRNIFSAFRFLLNSIDWLDLEDKEKLQKKVDNIRFNPGIPSWIDNDTKVMERIMVYNVSYSPFENEFRNYKIKLERSMNELMFENAQEDDTEPDPDFTFNAFYTPAANQIDICLGVTLPPMFNVTYPLAVIYGGLGSTISHELMHAFDETGIYSSGADEDDDDSDNWLSTKALEEFEKKKQCLVRQYSRSCDKDVGRCVEGDKTLGENIADIDGLKVAYTAYKVLTQVVGSDPPIQDMQEYSDDQLFFLASAKFFCTKDPTSSSDFEDTHTPNIPRVELSVKNVPLFAKAFGCIVGTKYAPMRPCSLWGELLEPARRRLK